MKEYFKLLRVHQYIKNLFIFLPMFFALKITDLDLLLDTFIAFISFSLTASAVYILNDYHDIEEDRKHKKKKYRPLAANTVSKKEAIVLMISLFLLGFIIMFSFSFYSTILLFIYIIMNIAYSFFLKHVAILDIVIIAIGFIIRLFIGSFISNVHLSKWIVIMTFLLALFLALAKRRDDVLIFMDTGEKTRKVIDGYNLKFLDISMSIMASVVIVAYISYTASIEATQRFNSQYLYLTALFVILGILRYLQITFVLKNSGSPTQIVLKDRFIQITLIFWLITFFWILY
ncbi:UbiA prenyltransferase family protein [Campylobacterota bacterium DY0563]